MRPSQTPATIWPRPNQPRSPPFSLLPSVENSCASLREVFAAAQRVSKLPRPARAASCPCPSPDGSQDRRRLRRQSLPSSSSGSPSHTSARADARAVRGPASGLAVSCLRPARYLFFAEVNTADSLLELRRSPRCGICCVANCGSLGLDVRDELLETSARSVVSLKNWLTSSSLTFGPFSPCCSK